MAEISAILVTYLTKQGIMNTKVSFDKALICKNSDSFILRAECYFKSGALGIIISERVVLGDGKT